MRIKKYQSDEIFQCNKISKEIIGKRRQEKHKTQSLEMELRELNKLFAAEK